MQSNSGVDFAILMKALYPACKILLFSGQAFLDSARAQGHDCDLLLKPIPPPELLAEIRCCHNIWASFQSLLARTVTTNS